MVGLYQGPLACVRVDDFTSVALLTFYGLQELGKRYG